jgi:transcriptional regulator with XRE-family HTH domain
MRRRVRQVDLAERIGYEQSYISALEAGLKGPPTPEFLERLVKGLELPEDEERELREAAEASQRKLVIEPDTPQDVYWLLSRLRTKLNVLTPAQVRVINEVLDMSPSATECRTDPPRRLRRQHRREVHM